VENSVLASPFARDGVGAKLIDNGFSPIPILSGTKRPAMADWTRYCDEAADDIQTRVWEKWQGAGVGIACGYNGLVAVDFDTDDYRIIGAVQSILPHALVEKAGRCGFTAFYRSLTPVDSRAFNIDGKRIIDLLADGRQSVIPPLCTRIPAGHTSGPRRWV
jgi:hypothetical protein